MVAAATFGGAAAVVVQERGTRRAPRRCRSGVAGSATRRWRVGAAAIAPLLLVLAAQRYTWRSLAAAAAPRGSPVAFANIGFGRGRHRSPVARSAERAAHIAVVDVDVTPGGEESFLKASLANAKGSAQEPANQRFDVLQSLEDENRFALVEIYGEADGPKDHKATSHYNQWRDDVAELMRTPRSATQWDTIRPAAASGFKASPAEGGEAPAEFDITHVFVDVVPGQEEAFIEATLKNVAASVKEEQNLRFDFMRSVEDPTKFFLVEVYRSPEGAADHKKTKHYLAWREEVADMMATPRVGKKYRSHFPTAPEGWQTA